MVFIVSTDEEEVSSLTNNVEFDAFLIGYFEVPNLSVNILASHNKRQLVLIVYG
jgi:hypothetical protein